MMTKKIEGSFPEDSPTESSTDDWNDLLLEVSGMSQEELIDAFVKGYRELAQVCGYTTEQIEKAEKVIRRKTKTGEG